jgi:hypothetical protein
MTRLAKRVFNEKKRYNCQWIQAVCLERYGTSKRVAENAFEGLL